MDNAILTGWNYASKLFGSDVAAKSGSTYVASVDKEIQTLVKNLEEEGLKNTPIAQLKGNVAEYMHAGTFNIDAALKGSDSRAFVDASTEFGSVDISTNFGRAFSLKYIATAKDSVKEQARNAIQAYHKYLSSSKSASPLSFEQYLEKNGYTTHDSIRLLIDDYHSFLKQSGCNISLEEFIKINNQCDISQLLMSVYTDQYRLIPSDQLEEGIKYLNQLIATESTKESSNRIAVLNNYKDTLQNLVDRISDGKGVESKPLSKEEAEAITALLKEGKFKPEDFGLTLKDIITTKYLISNALKAGYTAAVITLVMQLGPTIINVFEHLIQNGEIDVSQLKEFGVNGLSSSSEGFLRGFISSALTIACKAEKLGSAFKNANPSIIAALTVIVMDVAKSSVLLAAGKITAQEMGTRITKELIVSAAAIAGGSIGQAIAPEIPVLGYLIGSLVGSCIASVSLSISEKYLLSFCVDSGFTCFGLVKQDYRLPDDVLNMLNVNRVNVSRIAVNHRSVNHLSVNHYSVNRYEVNRIELVMVERGIIGINKVGYI